MKGRCVLDTRANVVVPFKKPELSDPEQLKAFVEDIRPEHIVLLLVKDGTLHCFTRDLAGFELIGVLQSAVTAAIEVNGEPASRP